MDVNSLQPCWVFYCTAYRYEPFPSQTPPCFFSKSLLSCVHRVRHAQCWSTDDIIPAVSGFKPSESYVVIADQNRSITDDWDNICEHGLRLDFIHHCYQFTHANLKHTFSSEWRIHLYKYGMQIALTADRNWFCWLSERYFTNIFYNNCIIWQ